MGYYKLPEGLNQICLVGPVMSASVEGIITRHLLKSLHEVYSDVTCFHIGPLLGPVRDDEHTRLAEKLMVEELAGETLIICASSKEAESLCHFGRTNLFFSFEGERTPEYKALGSTSFKALFNSNSEESWAGTWKHNYDEETEMVNQLLGNNKSPFISDIRISFSTPFGLLMMDSQYDNTSPDKIVENIKRLVSEEELERVVIYYPGKDVNPLAQAIHKQMGDMEIQIDVIPDWINSRDRQALKIMSECEIGTTLLDRVPGGTDEFSSIEEIIGTAVRDWIQGLDIIPGESDMKRLGFVCDFTPAEIHNETTDCMALLYDSIDQQEGTIESREWICRKAEIDCCLDTLLIFQPFLFTEDKLKKLAESKARKIFVATEFADNKGEWTDKLLKLCDLVIFRSPIQMQGYMSEWKRPEKMPKRLVHPLFLFEGPYKKKDYEVAVLELDFEETIDLNKYLGFKGQLVTNTQLPPGIPREKLFPWRDEKNKPQAAIWVAQSSRFTDMSRKPSVFNNPLASALLSGVPYQSQLFHGCMSYQNLAQEVTSDKLKDLWLSIREE